MSTTNKVKYIKPIVGQTIQSAATWQTPLVIKGIAGQTAPVIDVQDSAGTSLWKAGGTDFTATQVKSVALTAAQTKALFTTPITLVAAPGAGKVIVVDQIVGKNVFGTAAYAGANAMEFRYTDGAGVKVTGDLAAAFINNAAGTRFDVAVGAAAAVAVANAPVVVAVPVANPTLGDGIITLTVYYRIVS